MKSTKSSVGRSSVRVRWIYRFCGSGVADVIFIDKYGIENETIRIWGQCVDSRDARNYARRIRNGETPDNINFA